MGRGHLARERRTGVPEPLGGWGVWGFSFSLQGAAAGVFVDLIPSNSCHFDPMQYL